mmetsp:Transcript_7552/g.14557  ORF Transcript_7552/g.14557 Transcript_7552/m.14557 type:complete len:269 (+) Transcript_7552:13-819(+)
MGTESFDWNTALLRGIEWPLGTALVYLVTAIWLKRRYDGLDDAEKEKMKEVKPPGQDPLRGIQGAHNMVICLWSAAMFISTAWSVAERAVEEKSMLWFVCEHPTTQVKGALYWNSYVYYLSKYYELIDTYLALLRGRPPPSFKMHIYHHSVVLFMTWFWMESAQSMQFGGLLFNTFVHVIMYYYFYLRTKGIRVWWKNWITRLQIIQFVFSFCVMALWVWEIAVNKRECAGFPQTLFNVAFNASLLYLFLGVLRTNTKNKNKNNKKSE